MARLSPRVLREALGRKGRKRCLSKTTESDLYLPLQNPRHGCGFGISGQSSCRNARSRAGWFMARSGDGTTADVGSTRNLSNTGPTPTFEKLLCRSESDKSGVLALVLRFWSGRAVMQYLTSVALTGPRQWPTCSLIREANT